MSRPGRDFQDIFHLLASAAPLGSVEIHRHAPWRVCTVVHMQTDFPACTMAALAVELARGSSELNLAHQVQGSRFFVSSRSCKGFCIGSTRGRSSLVGTCLCHSNRLDTLGPCRTLTASSLVHPCSTARASVRRRVGIRVDPYCSSRRELPCKNQSSARHKHWMRLRHHILLGCGSSSEGPGLSGSWVAIRTTQSPAGSRSWYSASSAHRASACPAACPWEGN